MLKWKTAAQLHTHIHTHTHIYIYIYIYIYVWLFVYHFLPNIVFREEAQISYNFEPQ